MAADNFNAGPHVRPPAAAGATSVLDRLLPRRLDNAYRGHGLGIWFFAAVVLLKLGVSLDAIFNGRTMASAGDGIALQTFTAAAAQTVVSLFALWGLEHLVICLVCLLVLVRFRAMVPLMFALLLLEHLGRMLALQFLPIAKAGLGGESPGISPPPYGFLALIIVGLALSLWNRDNHREPQ